MLPPISPAWRSSLKEETRKPYDRALDGCLEKERAGGQTILPARKDIFNALATTSYDQVNVLLVGQDPYPTPGHAQGLCFSVQPTVRPLPLSLRNVYRELHEDLGCKIPNSGYLKAWASQGIGPNRALTVHRNKVVGILILIADSLPIRYRSSVALWSGPSEMLLDLLPARRLCVRAR